LWLCAAVLLLLFGPAFPQNQDTKQAPAPNSKQTQSKPKTEKPRERVPTDLAGADLVDSSKAKKQPQVPGGVHARVITDLSGFDLLESSKTKAQTQVAGATRGMARPIPLAPRLGKLYGGQPTFAWTFEGKAKNFLFVLQDDARNELFHAEVTGYEYRYPATAPALEPGKTYFWTVEVSSAMFGGEPSAPAGFLVLNPAQRAEVAEVDPEGERRRKASPLGALAENYQSALARARAFRDRRLWYDALDAYSALIARYPDRAELYEERGTIYAQLEATKTLAERDFARADQLGEHSASHN
jgi:hypothetical protein